MLSFIHLKTTPQVPTHLADKNIDLNDGCFFSDCSSWSCNNWCPIPPYYNCCIPTNPNFNTIYMMKPLIRSVRFNAKFLHNNDHQCDYDFNGDATLQSCWQKLMKISMFNAPDDRSIRLGWRWVIDKPDYPQMELALYAHINSNWYSAQMDEAPSYNYVDLETFTECELILSHFGYFVTAGDKAVAIKRKIFESDIYYTTGVSKVAFFEAGTSTPAPHDMRIRVEDIWVDAYISTFDPLWYSSPNKGFAYSEFYDEEVLEFYASNSIKAPLPCLGEVQGYIYSTLVNPGADITYHAGNYIHLLPGFHAENGSRFHAYIGPEDDGTTDIFDIMRYTHLGINGVLAENLSCGGFPASGDTLVLIKNDTVVATAITGENSTFYFNPEELVLLDTVALYSINTKSGITLQDTAHKTIAQWISESPLNFYYATTVNQEWVARYNGADSLNDVTSALDLQGNIYVTGSTLTDTTGYDMLTIKYDSSGTQKWAATYRASNTTKSDNARAITVDASGNVYITGESDTTGVSVLTTLSYNTSGTLRWVKKYQPSGCAQASAKCILHDHAGNIIVGGTSTCTSPSGKKIFTILKYDTNGNLSWTANYTGPATIPVDYLTSLAVDDSNNVYASGYSQGVSTNYDMATVKFSPSGTQLWVDRYDNANNGDDLTFSNTVDNNGNAIVTGYSRRSSGNDEIVTIKYNHNGSRNWVSVYNTDTHDYAYKALCNDSNEVYIGGQTGSTSTGMLALKYNSAGSLLWSKYSLSTNNFNFKSAALDNADNTYITGTTAINNSRNTDITTQKLNSDGDIQWTVTYNGAADSIDYPTQIIVSENGNVYVSANSIGNSTQFDFTTIKYSQCLSTAENLKTTDSNVPATVVNTVYGNSSISVIPNPNNGNMQIAYEIPENTNGKFEIYDMAGKKLLSYPLFGEKNTFAITGETLGKGIYFYRAMAGNKLIGTDKIVVIK